jgi:hypothetical protein
MPSVITANLLASGEVVYLTAKGRWVVDLSQAAAVHDEAGLALLEAEAQRAVASQHVTAVYAMDVANVDGYPTPLSVREKIRAAHQPTV